MNTSVVLPHLSWSPKAKNVKASKKQRYGSESGDDEKMSSRRVCDRRNDSHSPPRRRDYNRHTKEDYNERAPVRYEKNNSSNDRYSRQRKPYYDNEDGEHDCKFNVSHTTIHTNWEQIPVGISKNVNLDAMSDLDARERKDYTSLKIQMMVEDSVVTSTVTTIMETLKKDGLALSSDTIYLFVK